ncbi:hypothetical protein [Nocardioides sp. TF02-7]|uniref:hypothetical protein n=1 Tax=Nocardioides sp. TF02-7 TaxID=2917724 RepID=UPI001F0565FB|nr:hypothetical protein [Nocardioides sp. TF02-7]UMG92260.1 hypothetical protein MF408_20500 [Nocardioides sp. TF02-7]
MDDLIAALRLVSGEPFTELRKDHWNWLLDGDRWDHIMTSAIVDVGHIVTAHALATGDKSLALWAAQVAYAAATYDEVAQLDMIQAEKANGDDGAADQHLNEKGLRPPRRRPATRRPSAAHCRHRSRQGLGNPRRAPSAHWLRSP